ncbi:hypothetical protein UY3_02858 [Chelonia mydas]|uniref:Uncharacterized protein n=1 Tax=Chelonia mydas TaxID=8469 RepID=M7CG83_CHEMY|nr:hypothetical protein UY3_02858 [Chelonia mydas]
MDCAAPRKQPAAGPTPRRELANGSAELVLGAGAAHGAPWAPCLGVGPAAGHFQGERGVRTGRFCRSRSLESDFIQLIVYVPTKRSKSAECDLNTGASIDSWSGALWVAIPQSPLPIGILG